MPSVDPAALRRVHRGATFRRTGTTWELGSHAVLSSTNFCSSCETADESWSATARAGGWWRRCSALELTVMRKPPLERHGGGVAVIELRNNYVVVNETVNDKNKRIEKCNGR